jgi:hypothetical protein
MRVNKRVSRSRIFVEYQRRNRLRQIAYGVEHPEYVEDATRLDGTLSMNMSVLRSAINAARTSKDWCCRRQLCSLHHIVQACDSSE